jgi:hypothetical protein
MTQSSLRGARFYAAKKDPASITSVTLSTVRSNDGLIYVYWGALDKIGHAAGWQSASWARALEDLDQSVEHLATAIPRGWEIWLTADHGMVDVTDAPAWDVAADPELARDVEVVAGEARAIHLYTNRPQTVAERWRGRLGEEAWVLTKPQAIAAGLFGEVDSRAEPYLGDVVVAMAGRGIVLDSRLGGAQGRMIGHHGSLTAAEAEIPLLRWFG